jgi:hypothetical protein
MILAFGESTLRISSSERLGEFFPREIVLRGRCSASMMHRCGTIEMPSSAATILEIASSPSSSIASFTRISLLCSQASICLPSTVSLLKRIKGWDRNRSSGDRCSVVVDTRSTSSSVAIFENVKEVERTSGREITAACIWPRSNCNKS